MLSSNFQNKLPFNHKMPSNVPAVRCYLGETSMYDYNGRVAKQDLYNWLFKLVN